MIGTALDGFIAPRLLLDAAQGGARTGEATGALGIFTFRLIDVFTRIYVIGASVAIGAWSASMMRRGVSQGVRASPDRATE